MRSLLLILFLLFSVFLFAEGTLFVGLEGSTPPTFISDMEGFPNINWNTHFSMDVSGAAATPDGLIYLCEGAFTTHLYQASLELDPQMICTIANDMSALAYGRDTLWGYSNYASPLGIYSIDTTTGATELALATGSYRFFALDYNPADDLFYGYTEYGTSGLYSINIDSGEMILLTGSIPATNGQGRGMAVGDNTVFLTATRGDDGIPYFAYDISQGVGGTWVEFPNPYPAYHSTGGAAWIAAPDIDVSITGLVAASDFPTLGLSECLVSLTGQTSYETSTDENGIFQFPEVLQNDTYALEISHDGYETHTEVITVEIDDISLSLITLNELAFPAENVVATETVQYSEVTVSWDAPQPDERQLENYTVYIFLESFSGNPEVWQLLATVTETQYIDQAWADLTPALWQYAVIAQYTNGITAEAAFSNPLEKTVTGNNDDCLSVTNEKIYPNPCNPSTTFSYFLPQAARVEINIYNLKGQLINTLFTGEQTAGKHKLIWSGNDVDHKPQSSGIYFLNLKINGTSAYEGRILLLK
ncbi:MAG: T9SS type A sorting domain-containing protein [Candidatus Cloacimonetes bacterium]|nr:T9SS type A sorting domain-containing protein [Candidatus Cloacimonadota bacterium]